MGFTLAMLLLVRFPRLADDISDEEDEQDEEDDGADRISALAAADEVPEAVEPRHPIGVLDRVQEDEDDADEHDRHEECLPAALEIDRIALFHEAADQEEEEDAEHQQDDHVSADPCNDFNQARAGDDEEGDDERNHGIEVLLRLRMAVDLLGAEHLGLFQNGEGDGEDEDEGEDDIIQADGVEEFYDSPEDTASHAPFLKLGLFKGFGQARLF